MYTLDKTALNALMEEVISCGLLAKARQADVHRSYKSDGSVLTETDLEISERISDKVHSLFPECAFISEEAEYEIRDNTPYIFILDPIDGTDVYSQGLPSFAVALGILDHERRPQGAMIYLPRFGKAREDMTLRLDPGEKLIVDGKPFERKQDKDDVRQVTMGSGGQVKMDFSSFDGKVRTFGSSIIHLIAPVVFDAIEGCVNQPCFVWDVAAAHTVLL
ncbi:MAG: inositol monophosphatase family protein [Bullifex sp.]